MTTDLSLGDFTLPTPATSNGHGPAAVPGLPAAAAGDGDWALVRELSGRVGDRLTEALKARGQRGQRLDEAAKRQLGRALIEDELRSLIRARAELGEPTPHPEDEEWLRRAVFAVQFSVGRLAALLEQDDVENIIVAGCDRVQLKLADGRLVDGPPVADSDEELLELINRIGTRLGSAERSLSAAHPHFRMSLPDGSRLSALAYVCPRPQLAIRRHRIADKGLEDLVGMGMISRSLRAFLGALVRGRKSVLIVGPQDAGKTSLMRSMLHECPPSERVATIESEYELHLHRDPVRHPWVLPLEARPGSVERSGAGEVTLSDLVRMS
ncbi:MAG: ATPase, T2SS/T4P/T4SS family, partial [Mycobacteriales bacterium]